MISQKMLGIRKRPNDATVNFSFENHDVAKLFFDTFSKRLGSFETSLKDLAVEVGRLKISGDQSKLSDLVLLERLQKTERLLGESLNWIKQTADTVLQAPQATAVTSRVVEEVPEPVRSVAQTAVNQSSIRTDPSVVQPGSLNSITTPTELQVLTLLVSQGPKSAPEIGKSVGRSREHTARLMKKLFDEGYVRRDQTRIPFRYSTVERVKQSFMKPEGKDQERETVSAPQA
ncbi:TrmB family transcriptional regulator [Candidatus Bathyarchaeota archaeon]|nr:MAG: TrmB family transcriptional regulator [Candidatus Bathyarchaeota archaeon]